MKKISLTLIFFTIIFQSCVDDDCGECFTPPESFYFEIVDKTSGENLFANGTFEPEQIQITNLLSSSPVDFKFIIENDINLIEIYSIVWETEIVNLKFDVSDIHVFNFYVDAQRKMGDCCNYTDYKEITIQESDFELDTETGIYKILVE